MRTLPYVVRHRCVVNMGKRMSQAHDEVQRSASPMHQCRMKMVDTLVTHTELKRQEFQFFFLILYFHCDFFAVHKTQRAHIRPPLLAITHTGTQVSGKPKPNVWSAENALSVFVDRETAVMVMLYFIEHLLSVHFFFVVISRQRQQQKPCYGF